MKTRISAVPQDNVLIVNSGGYCNVSLFKNVVEVESGENNEKQYAGAADAPGFGSST